MDKKSRDKQKADPVIVKYRNLSVIVLVKQLTINIIDHLLYSMVTLKKGSDLKCS